MKLKDKRFWIAWAVMLVLMTATCVNMPPNEDTAMLGAAFAMSLVSTWLCNRVRRGAAFANLIVMIVYNALFSYNLIFNSRYGAGLTWWFFSLVINSLHAIILLTYCLIIHARNTGTINNH